MDLNDIATDGVLHVSAAAAIGIDSKGLQDLRRKNRIFRLHHGWYATTNPGSPLQWHRMRAIALVQEYEGRALASHGTAVVLHGLPDFKIDHNSLQFTWNSEGPQFKALARLNMHERLTGMTELPAGMGLVHPALAVVGSGLHDPRSMMVAGDAALAAELCTPAQLELATTAYRGQRGIIGARRAVGWCDGQHQSPSESLAAYGLHVLGWLFDPQVATGTKGPSGGAEHADFGIRGTNLLLEVDGRVKYTDPDPAVITATVLAERQRHKRIESTGLVVERLDSAECVDLRRLDATVRKGLARCGLDAFEVHRQMALEVAAQDRELASKFRGYAS